MTFDLAEPTGVAVRQFRLVQKATDPSAVTSRSRTSMLIGPSKVASHFATGSTSRPADGWRSGGARLYSTIVAALCATIAWASLAATAAASGGGSPRGRLGRYRGRYRRTASSRAMRRCPTGTRK